MMFIGSEFHSSILPQPMPMSERSRSQTNFILKFYVEVFKNSDFKTICGFGFMTDNGPNLDVTIWKVAIRHFFKGVSKKPKQLSNRKIDNTRRRFHVIAEFGDD